MRLSLFTIVSVNLTFTPSLISAFEFLDSFHQIGTYGQSLLSHLASSHEPPFTLNSPGIYNDLLEFANYSGAAYCIDTIEGVQVGFLNSSCVGKDCVSAEDDVYVVNVIDDISNALILKDLSAKQIIIAFQGSVMPVDWVIDTSYFDLNYVPYGESHGLGVVSLNVDYPKVHTGFKTTADNFLSLGEGVLSELHKMYPDFTFRVTGHSLGGALAALTGLELYLMGYDVSIVSFAAPKVFNPALASWVDQEFHTEQYINDLKEGNLSSIPLGTYTRLTHYGDIVPCVPLADFVPEFIRKMMPFYIPYSHAGVEFFIDKTDLPQAMDTVKVRGLFSSHYEKHTWLTLGKHMSTSIAKMLKDNSITRAHLFYFEVVSECQHRNELDYEKYD